MLFFPMSARNIKFPEPDQNMLDYLVVLFSSQ